MEPDKWKTLDFLGLLLCSILCFAGFYQMNFQWLVLHQSRSPPLPLQYEGALLFALGIISFIIFECGRKFEQGRIRVITKKIFLITIFLMAILSVFIFSRSYIII
jgi:hypothetical protein